MTFPFVQAANFYPGRRRFGRVIIVMHDMEADEGPKTAENVAQFFHRQPHGSGGSSAHFCVDQNSVVQCVKVGDTAWHAPGANADGIGIEQAGHANQTRAQWIADTGLLDNAAKVAAEMVVAVHKAHPNLTVAVRRLSVAEIKAGNVSGFAGHNDISAAYTPGGHTDPGTNYPWDVFLSRVQLKLKGPLTLDWC